MNNKRNIDNIKLVKGNVNENFSIYKEDCKVD